MDLMDQTEEFSTWLKGLKDSVGKAKIIGRIRRAERGNFGDAKHFDGISEMRVDMARVTGSTAPNRATRCICC